MCIWGIWSKRRVLNKLYEIDCKLDHIADVAHAILHSTTMDPKQIKELKDKLEASRTKLKKAIDAQTM